MRSSAIGEHAHSAVRIEVIGTSLKAYLDGVPQVVATDAEIPAGGIAIGTKNATAEFDDVKVWVP